MELGKKYKALRVYLSNTDKVDHASAYETIAYKARQSGLAGATVYKGLMGYGTSSELTPVKFWEFTEKVPVVVEMIDEESKIDACSAGWVPAEKTCRLASNDCKKP